MVSLGKAYGDLANALDMLGIDAARAAELGIKTFKVGNRTLIAADDLMAWLASYKNAAA